MALPQELAVDRPLKLGATFNGSTTDGFLTYRYDFQPDSMQRVSHGDLLFFGKEQEKINLVPELPEGDAPFYYDGPCTTLQQQDGEDTECIAIFNGTEWILELVSARITAKHVRGTPQIRGYNIDVDDEAAAAPQPPSAPHLAAAADPAADDDIDQDLNDALDEALFAADTAAEEHTGQHQLQPAAASPPVLQHQQQPLHQAVEQQLATGPAGQQQSPQHQAAAVQQLHMQQQEQSEQDPDDPWAEYDTASAAPATMQAAPAAPPPLQHVAAAGVQPTAAGVQPDAAGAQAAAAGVQAAAAGAQAAAAGVQPTAVTGAGGVGVVTVHEEGQSEEEDQDEDAVHACSDDDSDGLGVEVF